MLTRRTLVTAALLSATLLFMAACSGSGPDAKKAAGSGPTAAATVPDELIYAFGAFADTLDPAVQFALPTYSTSRMVFDPLVYRDFGDLKVKPWLATEWKVESDSIWRFKLRQGIKFQNGEAFDARSVKASLDRYQDPKLKSGQSPIMEKLLTKVEVVNDYEVLLHTNGPRRNLLDLLALVEMVPPAQSQDLVKFAKLPAGTGPYRYTEFVPGQRVVMEANPDYWAYKPQIKRLVYRIMPEEASRVAALETGEVDVAVNVPFELVPRVKQTKGVQLMTGDTNRVAYVALKPNTFEPFLKKELREAIFAGVDRQAILTDLLDGKGYVPQALTPHNVPFTTVGLQPAIEFNPQKAKQLLAQAGYPDGITIRIGTTNGRYMRDVEVAQAISTQLANVGIKVKVLPTEFAAYRTERLKTTGGTFDMYVGYWGVLTNEMDWGLRAHFMSGAGNFMGYKNPRVDELLDQAQASLDDKKADELYKELQQITWGDRYILPLFTTPAVYGVSDRAMPYFESRVDEFDILKNRYTGYN